MSLKTKLRRRAFTLLEMLIAVAVLAAIVGLGFPALRTARSESEKRTAEGNAKTLNDARERAILSGAGGINTMEEWNAQFGTNGIAATEFLIENGLVRPPNTVN